MAYQHPSQHPYDSDGDVSPVDGPRSDFPPPPPAHRNPVGLHADSSYNQMHNQRQYGSSSNYTDYTPPRASPGEDNLGEGAAGGGFNGIAVGVAGTNERNSRGQAANTPFADQYAYGQHTPPRPIQPQPSYNSRTGLTAAAAAPPSMYSSNSSQYSTSMNSTSYQDSPYNRYSSSNLDLAQHMGQINPNDVADDDEWGMGPAHPRQKRKSFVPFASASSRDSSRGGTPGGAAAAGAAAGGAAFGASRDGSGSYNAVPGGDGSSGNQSDHFREKSEWLDRQNTGRKRLTIIVCIVIAILVIGGIVGGVLGTMLDKGGGNGSDTSAADAVEEDNKEALSLKDDEIQKLMNNDKLHKVFPGMDYTPLNAQYPDCLHVPPSQNNITRDMAVMSQLTNAVRLYGTDCNQTQMVLHSMKSLELTDMKLWLGVWVGDNETTNDRQLSQMWDIIDEYGVDDFKGIIIGNEVLFREEKTVTELTKYMTDIKKELHDKNLKEIPIGTSDLGDNWTENMATKVDLVMSNVHPFFAGVEVSKAAGWTWNFWQQKDVVLTADDPDIKQIVAEVGWPTGGGNNCGEAGDCKTDTEGSVAGVDEMNQFMQDWICPSLKNGTEYFWFSAFDEPWKVRFNEDGKEWEDKWGLMDVDRNLKPGVTIPDCDGKTVS